MSIEKILIVDDEVLVRNFLVEVLQRKKIEVEVAENGQKALHLLKEFTYDLVITDLKLPDMTGIEILKKVKEYSPSTLVILITAYGSIENAVETMKLGAFNYLLKPFSAGTIEAILDKAKEHSSLIEENKYLRQQISPIRRYDPRIIAESDIMKQVLAEVLQIAKSNAAVFIDGESGTGKEVIAHAIHYNSLRASKPFIKVNCAAVPETLIESEFFGHEKGSFTGAQNKRVGRFELANEGTLLLDEITEIPIALQAKLLRVIQEQEFERVGGSKPIHVDVRLISTSNRNIKDAIANKVLREDLYYRLNVIPVHLPPLRKRAGDIIPLANYFLEVMGKENHRQALILSPEAMKKLENYQWPGNIRELANVIERAVVMSSTKIIGPELLFLDSPPQNADHHVSQALPQGMSLHDLEKKLILETLHAQQQNRTKTAEILGISVKTLRNKLHEYNIELKE